MSHPRLHHAIVIGASMAGLTTARVLADHADAVTVLDRDDLPAGPTPRKAVPQDRHAHTLLAAGARTLESLFPGIMGELIADGAATFDFNRGFFYQADGYRAPSLLDRQLVNTSRPFLEGHVRRRLAALPNVEIRGGVSVGGLLATGDRVRGVRVLDDGAVTDLAADFVVDCSGRSSQAGHWLAEIGFPAPTVDEVRADVRYATMLLERSPSDLDGTFSVTLESPPHGKRAAFLLPIEGDRWIATIGSSYGAPAPTDEESFRASAATLPAPEMALVLARASVLSSVAHHRMVSSKRRRYEKLRRVPAGFVALGDAVCSFNPVYAQGMSSAMLQAVALDECIAGGDNDQRLVRAFYKGVAKVLVTPWTVTVGSDFAHPEVRGPKPFGTSLRNRYLRRVLLAARVSPEVNTAMILVQNLVNPASTLFKPSMMRTVWSASRMVERHGSPARPRYLLDRQEVAEAPSRAA